MKNVKLNTKLFDAVNSKNLKKAAYLLNIGADICFIKDGESLIDVARKTGDVDVMDFVKNKMTEAFRDTLDEQNSRMLILELQKIRQGRTLISSKRATELGEKLWDAVEENNYKEVVRLINEGADIEYVNGDKTSLMVAADEGYKDIFNLLINEGANIRTKTEHGWSALTFASDVELVKTLIDMGGDLNAKDDNGDSLLAINAYNGNYDVVKYLIEIGMDINAQNDKKETALNLAIDEEYYRVAMLLIDKGCNFELKDDEGDNALMRAVVIEMEKIAFELLDRGANPNTKDKDGWSVLMAAVDYDCLDIARKIIEKGGNVNEKYLKNGKTPLMIAISNDYCEDMVNMLIDNGADVNICDDENWSVLMKAVEQENLELMKIFIKNGSDVNAKNSIGRTALLNASLSGFLEGAKLLVDNGADVNLKDDNGRSPLMEALFSENSELVEFLIEKGADIFNKDKNGKKVIDYARNNEDKKLVIQQIKNKEAKEKLKKNNQQDWGNRSLWDKIWGR